MDNQETKQEILSILYSVIYRWSNMNNSKENIE